MPSVMSKTGQVDLTVQAELLKELNHVTADEVDAAIAACVDYSTKSKASKIAEEQRNKLLAGLYQKVLGIKSIEEIKTMDGDALSKLVQERAAAGMFKLDKEFNFKQTSDRRSPNYQKELIKAIGQAKVIEIQQNEPHSYSYVVIAAAPEK